MKKIISLILIISCLFFTSACTKEIPKTATSQGANEFLTDFFASYTDMNEYLKSPDIAISAFALDGQGLSSILKAVYQAQSVTFAFPEPVKVSENVYSASVTVIAPDIEPLYEMYALDRILAEDDTPDSFVAQSFYDNIRAGTTSSVTTTVDVTVRFDPQSRKWTVDPNNDLAFGIFPNIDKAN